jgi:hypothetical protein
MVRDGFWLLLFVMLALIVLLLMLGMNNVASAQSAIWVAIPAGLLQRTDCHPVSCEALREVEAASVSEV